MSIITSYARSNKVSATHASVLRRDFIYGDGIYSSIEPEDCPEMYGDNVYRIQVLAEDILFLDYDDFLAYAPESLKEKCDKDNFVRKQCDYYDIDISDVDDDVLESVGSSADMLRLIAESVDGLDGNAISGVMFTSKAEGKALFIYDIASIIRVDEYLV